MNAHLLSRFADAPLAGLARFPLVHGPTPLEPLDQLTCSLGRASPRLWVKRDDCTGLAGGGNKARKLELLVADALARSADTLITAGAIQSNHARQTAAAAARAGLACLLVLTDSVPGRADAYLNTGNVQLDRLLGAEITVISDDTPSAPVMDELAQQLRARGRRPYVIPLGGSNGLGSLGYVAGFFELLQQASERGLHIEAIALPTGSAGTHAGLLLGAEILGWAGAILGFSVGRRADDAIKLVQLKREEARAALPRAVESKVAPLPVQVDDRFAGPAYGVPDAVTRAAIEAVAQKEGLLLDPVYTGKAMAGLLSHLRDMRFDPSVRNVVFLHTGGAMALSAYPEITDIPVAPKTLSTQ